MYLKENCRIDRPANLNPGDASLLGKTVRVNIDRTWPISHIIARVSFTTGTALTLFPATAQTPDQYDNILQLVQHINLSVNPGGGGNARTVVDCAGVRLLEYNALTGVNLDAPTLDLIQLSQSNTLPAASSWQLTYNIPCSEAMVAEPLRSRLLLPVHRYTQDPVLTLTFQSLANIASAGAILVLGVEIELVRSMVTAQSEAILQKIPGPDGTGYIQWDLIEQPFAVANLAAEQKFPLALGAAYINLLCSQYLGGTNVTRNPIDASGIGDTVAHGFGNETLWRMETGLVPDRFWTWKGQALKNQMASPRNNVTQSSSPFFGGPVMTNTNFQSPSCVLFDFLRGGVTNDPGSELGSVLDCNLSGSLKKEIIGACATAATNPSSLNVMGRRFFNDLSAWQNLS